MSSKLVTSLYHTIGAHTSDVNCVAFSNDNLLATASADKTARVWNIEDFSEHKQSPFCGHQYYVHCCTFSPFGTTLATCSTDGKLILWDISNGKKKAILHHESQNSIRVCRFSPNSMYILTGSDDELLCMWEVSSKKLVRSFVGHEASVVCCDFSPDSNFIISGSCNGDIQVWDAKYGHGKCLKYIEDGHDLGVSCCQFSPTYGSATFPSDNGTVSFMFASGGQDDIIKVWDFQAVLGSVGVSVTVRTSLKGHSAPITCCTFSHDGLLIASGSIDKTVVLWDALHGLNLHVIEGHIRYVTSCAFSYDGKLLATASNDKTAMIWKITTEEELFRNIEQHQSECDGTEMKPLNKWTVQDVCKWLNEIGLEQYVPAFEQNAIDGTELEVVTDGMLQQIGVEAMGHRNKLMRARKSLNRRGSPKNINDPKNMLDVGVPDEFLCPITREIMKDPVIAEDGYTYERSAIGGWMEKGKTTSPMTNGTLNTKQLTPNRSLKMLIQRYLQGQ